MIYKRKCPNCDFEITYNRKDNFNRAIKANTICNKCSAYKYKKTFKDIISDDAIKKMRATKAGFKNWEEYVEKYPKKQFYKREVWKYTYGNDLSILENFDKRGRCGVDGAYQIDHIMSINYGWENKVPPQEIGHIRNLKMIPWQENRKKGK